MIKPLTEIAQIAQRNFKSMPKGSRESNDWFRVWKLATDGDARTLSDDPTVAEEKRSARKRSKKTP